MKPNIVLFDTIHASGIDILKGFSNFSIAYGADRKRTLELCANANVIIIKSSIYIDRELIQASRKLNIVARAGTGIDNIDIDFLNERKIKLFTSNTGNSISAAEFTIMQILNLQRKTKETIQRVANNDFRRHLFEGYELFGKIIGIVGYGNVGKLVAERLKVFGCKLICYDPEMSKERLELEDNFKLTNQLEDLLKVADVITIHARLNKFNRHMFSKKEFNLMKPGVQIVNTARADLIDQEALVNAIKKNIVSHAALDVISPEMPSELPPEDHSYSNFLLKNDRIFITPHIGASTIEAQKRISLEISMKIRDYYEKRK